MTNVVVDGEPISENEVKRSTMSIPVYTADAIKGIRAACRATAEVLEIAGKVAKPGVTTDEIDRSPVLARLLRCLRLKADRLPLI